MSKLQRLKLSLHNKFKRSVNESRIKAKAIFGLAKKTCVMAAPYALIISWKYFSGFDFWYLNIPVAGIGACAFMQLEKSFGDRVNIEDLKKLRLFGFFVLADASTA